MITMKWAMQMKPVKLMQKSEDARIARLEEQVMILQGNMASTAGLCRTCTRATHASGECPGKKLECFACGLLLLGHFKGSAVCKGKKVAVAEIGESDTEMDGIGRVVEVVRAAGSNVKNKTTQLQIFFLKHIYLQLNSTYIQMLLK